MAVAPGAHNLARLAESTLERLGDADALWFDGVWHRSAALHDRASRLAGGLPVEPGDRVVVLMENQPDVGVVYQAAWRAGAVVTPVIFLLPAPELRRILEDCGAAVVVTSPVFRDTVEEAARDVGSVRAIVATGEELDALAGGDLGPIAPRADGDLAALIYTGGTTGRAKGVMLSHENLWCAGKAGQDNGYVPGVVRSLTSLPLSHAYGLLLLAVGMHAREPQSSVLMRWFEPATWLEHVQTHGVQIAAVVPSMLQLLIAHPLEDFDLSSLRYVICGAAPLPPEVADEFERRVPGVEIREGYGLSESTAIVSGNKPGHVRRGSVGVPVPGSEVRVDAPPGEVGEICVRSRTVMLGYWNAPELTAETVRDGWLRTGDLGRFDPDGYLYVVDRTKDVIIRGGFNVFPRDVEDALLEHPAVVEAAVVGRPDERHGEEVVAFVAGAVTADEVVAFAKGRIGGYKYPREVHVVDSLPLTPIGKIDRKALRAKLVTEAHQR
jgi:long-chain acyl-CoA synthetase